MTYGLSGNMLNLINYFGGYYTIAYNFTYVENKFWCDYYYLLDKNK